MRTKLKGSRIRCRIKTWCYIVFVYDFQSVYTSNSKMFLINKNIGPSSCYVNKRS